MSRLTADAEGPVEAPANDEKSVKKESVGALFVKRLYDGDTEKLPNPAKDKKGKITKSGEARFFLRRGVGRYELQAIYKARGGVKTRLVRNLIDSTRRPQDRALIVALKKAGAQIV